MKVNGHWVPCVRNSSYSFMPIHLKLYMYYGHGLKICMWFVYNPWIIFCHFFSQFELSHFIGNFSGWIEGTLVVAIADLKTIRIKIIFKRILQKYKTRIF